MIKYDIGLGETCITVGLAKVEQGTAMRNATGY